MSKSDYYIYAHIGNKSGEIFYIGRGRGIRARVKAIRPQYWKDKVLSEEGYTVRYLCENLTKGDSIKIENEILSNNLSGYNLINKRKSFSEVSVPLADVMSNFSLSKTSPSGFVWKVKPKGCTRVIGDIAGNKVAGDYWQINIKGESYMAHRLVYQLHFPFVCMKGKVVNHIDCDPSNNKIENLELVTQEENLQKTKVTTGRSLSKANKTGHNGLCLSKSTGYELMIARFNNKSKAYSVNKYGLDCATELCLVWLEEQRNAAE